MVIRNSINNGVPEGVTLLEFEGANQEEEPEVQEADEAVAAEELPECPDHQPSSFLKVEGEEVGSIQSKLLCQSLLDLYIGDDPFDKNAKDDIHQNIASILKS
ncbi:fatty-acid-binding protein 1-like isoform X1 [Miscanthus floridulus]|uniref:fatty-acid-binding protein 1-like isoform X1 n=1 Tax=Miscanthus floridulus TaxID=154761 RepID=UPI003458CB4F